MPSRPRRCRPTVGQTWHAALAFDICGKAEPALPATASGSANGLTTTGSGVLLIAPKTGSEAGNNATLGKFAKEYADAEADQHLGAVSRGRGLQERPEVRQGDAGRRPGGRGAGSLVDPVDDEPEERERDQAGGRQLHLEAGQPQASQQPTDHAGVRTVHASRCPRCRRRPNSPSCKPSTARRRR